MPTLFPVRVLAIDQLGLTLWGRGDRVIDVCFDDRRIWSFWLTRDTSGRRGSLRRSIAWPPALRRFLHGSTRITIRDHVSGRVRYDAEHRFGDAPDRIALVGRTGAPLALDKSNRLSATFDVRSGDEVEPLLDALALVLDLLADAGVQAFPAYGTLLGAVREGRLLGHDSDADVSYVSRWSDAVDVVRESFALQRLFTEQGLTTYRYSGAAFRVDVEEGDGVVRGLDVFAGFLSSGRLYVMGEIGTEFDSDWLLPLGSCELAGRRFPAPARAEKWLEAAYGPGWRVPDPAFKFETSRHVTAQLTGWFRGTQVGRQGWERSYSRSRAVLPPRRPSRLARRLLEDAAPGSRVLDVGAGRARDSWFLARKGLAVTAYDFVPYATEAVLERARRRSLGLDVRYLNLCEWRSVFAEGARQARMPGPSIVLARHVADATDAFGRDALFRFAAMSARGGGRLYAEVWTGQGRAPRKLSPVALSALADKARRYGGAIVSADEIAPFRFGKRQSHSIGRLVVEWE